MAISEQVLHPGVVEAIKAPLPFGIPDTPDNRAALAAALAEPAPVALPVAMPAPEIAPVLSLEPTPPLVAAAPTPAPVIATVDEAIEARMEAARLEPAPAPVAAAAPTPPVTDAATPAGTATDAVVEACTAAASTTWNWTKCAGRVLNGLRTLLFFGVMGGTAILAKLEAFDLSGLVSRVSGKQIAAEDIMLFMSAAGIVLRFVTNTPVFERWRKAAQGDKQEDASTGLDDGDVG